MHAAEDDVVGVGLRGEAGELEGIACQVGVLINVGSLVMMAEHDRFFAQLGTGGADAFLAVGVGKGVETVKLNGGGLHDDREPVIGP